MSSASVNGRDVEQCPPEPLPGRGAAVAVVVAHPDDESLWAGGLLLSHPEWRVFVAALCRRSDPDRAPKFYLALKRLGADGAMGDLDDGPQQRPLSEVEVASQVLALLPAGVYDLVMTHSPRGEYTRHRRHEETARAVLRLWREGTLHAKALLAFAYEDGGGAYLPRAEDRASLTLPLPDPVWAEKRRIITDIYGFQEGSWEARTVPRREAFWRAGVSGEKEFQAREAAAHP